MRTENYCYSHAINMRKGDEQMRQFVRFRIMIQCSPAAPPHELLNLLYWRLYLHHIIVCASLGAAPFA